MAVENIKDKHLKKEIKASFHTIFEKLYILN